MKRTLFIIVSCIALCLALAGCGGSTSSSPNPANKIGDSTASASASTSVSSDSATAASSSASASTTNTISNGSSKTKEIQEITLGQTISTKEYDFTLNDVSLTYDVMPSNPPSYYHHWPADTGYVYVYANVSIHNTSKKNLACDEVYRAKAFYGDGYTYNGFTVAEEPDGDFTYSNIREVSQLETKGVHCLVSCPEVVDTDAESPLYLVFTMSDKMEYKYTIR